MGSRDRNVHFRKNLFEEDERHEVQERGKLSTKACLTVEDALAF